MDAIGPFSEQGQKEIRQVAKILFSGGSPDFDPVIYELYKKWVWWFDLFFICIDRKHGNLLRLPFNTSPVQQPFKTMQIIKYLQSFWIEKIIEENKKGLK